MPNHCSNSLKIIGPTKDVEQFVTFVKNNGDDKDDNPYELFSNLIPMPKELEGTTSPSKNSNVDLIDKYGHDNWYDWCNAKWGTKWGDYNIHSNGIIHTKEFEYPILENGENDYDNAIVKLSGESKVDFMYDTAWAP